MEKTNVLRKTQNRDGISTDTRMISSAVTGLSAIMPSKILDSSNPNNTYMEEDSIMRLGSMKNAL